MKNSNFKELNSIDVSKKIEKKGGLSYLSWAWAWAELKKKYPEANSKVYENSQGWNYFTDGITGWVKTGVIIDELEHIEYLPIMDFRNKSIPADKITSTDVNKAIQRSITKAIGRHGLGLYIYAGEDLPEVVFNFEFEKSRLNLFTKMSEINDFNIMIKSCDATKEEKTQLQELSNKKSEDLATEFKKIYEETFSKISKSNSENDIREFSKEWLLNFPKGTLEYNKLIEESKKRIEEIK